MVRAAHLAEFIRQFHWSATGCMTGSTGRLLHLLAHCIEPADRRPIYIQTNKTFRLPEDPTAPVIMIVQAPE
jgi:sulfite reductase alpha subunit-like flavoprotein